jgi:hypothetical protein
MKNRLKYFLISFLLILITISIIFLNRTVKVLEPHAPGFTALRNDDAARRFAPSFFSSDEFGFPVKCYYRAARDAEGNLHFAYHPVWEYERNDAGGLMPFLSRILYTGGLRIQRIMFGKGDVELISVTVNPAGKIIGFEYERPKDYNPSTFTVAHQTVRLKKEFARLPVLRVASWNHLFEFADDAPSGQYGARNWRCQPEYFSEELWNEYTMVRLKETPLRKSRAHLPWERMTANTNENQQ